MAFKTPEEYIESIAGIKPRIFIAGKRIDDVTRHPNTRPGIDAVAKTYELALDPEHEELMTATSHLTSQKISRWNYVPRSIDDLVKRRQMNLLMSQTVGVCWPRCAGTQSLQVLESVTYAMHQKLGTEYNKRFNDYLRYIQENDLSANAVQTDAKGDRTKRPLNYDDPDLSVHVVERSDDGIIVRGAKVGPENPFAVHELIVFPPVMPLIKGEENYAVCFAIPAGTQGITYVCQSGPMEAERREAEDIGTLGSPVYGTAVSVLYVFDDVFVPWERVFMCGEIEFAEDLLTKFESIMNPLCACGCKVGFMDLIIGAAQTIAEYNGVAGAAHIRDKLTEMIRVRESLDVCGMAAVQNAKEDPSGSGVYFPDIMPGLMGNLICHYDLPQSILMAADVAGGSVVTYPSELELRNPETSQYVERFLRGVASVPTEDRMRMLKFLQHWTAGQETVRIWHGTYPPATTRLILYRQAEGSLEEKKKLAKKLAGIKES